MNKTYKFADCLLDVGRCELQRDGEQVAIQPKALDLLRYLIEHIDAGPHGGSLAEGGGNLYSHAIAAIALCEAYAMTEDKKLKAPAYVEDKDSGELRRPHHIDLKSGMYRGRQVLEPKDSI